MSIDLGVRDTDLFDSREIMDQIESLESQTEECEDCDGTGESGDEDCMECDGTGEVLDLDDDERETLEALRDLVEEVGFVEMRDGVTFIAEHYFTRYAEDYAEDIGAINRDASWPLNHIDWEAAAEDLKQDYSATEIDGTTYYYRA